MSNKVKKNKKENKPTMLGMTILEVVHEAAKDLYEVGGIDEVTMREYDELCLPPVEELSAKQIKKIRTREKVSQPVFAKILNLSPSTVKQWEQGTKKPRGGILTLLHMISSYGLSAVYKCRYKY